MTGKELLLKAIRNETTPRPAWVPFVGVHGAQLVGCTADEYLKSSELILSGLKKARELYQPDGLPVCFDLQIEAEILGCELDWAKDAPPSVTTHPLSEGKGIQDLPVFDIESGRFPVVFQALESARAEMGEEVALYGLICGPFTLALHLMGNEIFLQMFDHPDYVKAVMGYCSSVCRKTVEGYLSHGADVIAVVDPMTSQINHEHFRDFCTPHLNHVFDSVREMGGYSSLFVCGDASRNLEVMSKTHCDNISIDENIPLENIRDYTRGESKSFGGNLRLTTVLLLGDTDDSKLDAIRCLDIGGGAGFILAPGCDLPFATPTENLQAVSEIVHDSYKREVARRTIIAKSAESADEIELPDYAKEEAVYLDVITLDSSSCAPCQYMLDAAHRAARNVDALTKVVEHRITTREGIAMMTRLGVGNIPTLCLDGEPAFVSLIPDENTLRAAIQKAKEAKTS